MFLFDAFLHEVHHSLIIGLQAKYNLQTAGLTHGLEQLPGQILLEPHLAGPLRVHLGVDQLGAEAFGRRQRKALIGEEKERRLVALHQLLEILNYLFRLPLPKVLMVERQRAKCAIFIVTAARELNRQDRLRREVLAERHSIKVRRREGINVFGIERLIDDDLTILAVDQVWDLTEVACPLELMHHFQEGGLPFEDHEIIRELEHRFGPSKIVDQPGEDAAPNGQMHIGIGLLDQTA